MTKYITQPIVLPKLGTTMVEGTISKWLVKEGDKIEKGQPLLEVLSDKANIEIESPETGFLAEIIEKEGETLPVGKIIGVIAKIK